MSISIIAIKEDFTKLFGPDILTENQMKQYVFFYKYFPYTIFGDNDIVREIFNKAFIPLRQYNKTEIYDALYAYFYPLIIVGFGRQCDKILKSNISYQYHIKNKSNHARYDYHEIDKLVKQFKL